MTGLRAPVPADAAGVARLRGRFSPESFPAERLTREWSAPGFDPERDARIDEAGYAAVEELDEDRTWIELHGDRPELLLAWALDRATGKRLFSGAWEPNAAVKHALEEAGFTLIRHSYRMAIELDGVPAAPALPAGLELRTFSPGDEQAVYETHMETFVDSWEHVHETYEQWLRWLVERPGFDPELWLLAVQNGQIAGIVLCRVHDDDAESLTGAHRLYERSGMHVIARFDMYEQSA